MNLEINKKELEVFLRENIDFLRKKKGFSFKNTTRTELLGVVQNFLLEYAEELNDYTEEMYSSALTRNPFVERIFYKVLFDGYSIYIFDKEKRKVFLGSIKLTGTKEEIGIEMYKMIMKREELFQKAAKVFSDNFESYLEVS